jgi:cyanophycinase
MRQWLLREAGGFGARLVLITVEPAHVQNIAILREQLASWECEQVDEIVAPDRLAARSPAHVAPVEQATAIVLVGDNPKHWAAILGGTPLAQAIRRANARSKVVAGIGAVSALLPQHIISPGAHPQTLRGAVAFGPGLGLVNRLVVDAAAKITDKTTTQSDESKRRLLAAVATNPFLIGVALSAGSAAILYSNNTLQASGPNPLAIVDGQAIEAADLDAAGTDAVVGALHYTLRNGDGFNLDDHSLRPVGEVDLPPTGPVTSVF